MEGKKNIRIVSFDGETVEFERVECGTISKLALEEKLNSIRLCRNQHHFAKEQADSALAALDEEEAKLKELFAILAQAEAEFAPLHTYDPQNEFGTVASPESAESSATEDVARDVEIAATAGMTDADDEE